MNDTCFSVVTEDRTLDVDVGDKPTRDKWVIALLYLRFGIQLIISLKGYSGGNRRVKVPSSAVEEAQRLVRRQSQADSSGASPAMLAMSSPQHRRSPSTNDAGKSAQGWGAVGAANVASPNGRPRLGSSSSVTSAGARPPSGRQSASGDASPDPGTSNSPASPFRADSANSPLPPKQPELMEEVAPIREPDMPPVDLESSFFFPLACTLVFFLSYLFIVRREIAKYHAQNTKLQTDIDTMTTRIGESQQTMGNQKEQIASLTVSSFPV